MYKCQYLQQMDFLIIGVQSLLAACTNSISFVALALPCKIWTYGLLTNHFYFPPTMKMYSFYHFFVFFEKSFLFCESKMHSQVHRQTTADEDMKWLMFFKKLSFTCSLKTSVDETDAFSNNFGIPS